MGVSQLVQRNIREGPWPVQHFQNVPWRTPSFLNWLAIVVPPRNDHIVKHLWKTALDKGQWVFFTLPFLKLLTFSDVSVSLGEGYRMPCFLKLFDSWALSPPRAFMKILRKSDLWVTPPGTCVPWSCMRQVVMAIYWRNWLVYTNKGRGSQMKLTLLQGSGFLLIFVFVFVLAKDSEVH